jgi:uncharacterized protein (DUF2141 family)
MKARILLLAIAIFTMSNIFAQEGKTITVNITGVKGEKGLVMVALYNKADNFLREAYKASYGEVKDNKTTVVFKDVPSGTYAISCFYDKNGNHKLDANNMGIPTEQIGMSNNAKGFMGPPKFEDAKFSLTFKNLVQDIKL